MRHSCIINKVATRQLMGLRRCSLVWSIRVLLVMEGLVLVWLQLVGLVLVLVVGVAVWESPSIGHRVMGYGGVPMTPVLETLTTVVVRRLE